MEDKYIAVGHNRPYRVLNKFKIMALYHALDFDISKIKQQYENAQLLVVGDLNSSMRMMTGDKITQP